MLKIATPISHLFVKPRIAKALSDLSDALELRDNSPGKNATPILPVLYHCEQSIVCPLDLNHLQRMIDPLLEQERLVLVSLHMLSCYKDPQMSNGMFQPGEHRMERPEMLNTAWRNVEKLSRMCGTSVTIAVENNNYYPTGAYDVVTEASFIRKVVEMTGIHLLVDLAHARISAHNMGICPEGYLVQLPLERAIQVHLSGYATNEAIWHDSHEELSENQWREAERCLRRLPGVQFVTLEYYQEADVLARMLIRLRALLNGEANKSLEECNEDDTD
jgi:uncharacterized protein (UPF0276 family)